MSVRVGYGRVSTRDQNPDSQRDALRAAGCAKVFVDRASGKLDRRPELDAALEYLRPGDTLVITRLSRAARSLKHLLELTANLRERGVELQVLKQGIDTTTPTGRLAFHMLGAIDEFLRELIVEGTHEGLAAARARGRKGGRPAALTAAQVAKAREMYETTGPDGKRAFTVDQIATRLKVGRATIYRHLQADHDATLATDDQDGARRIRQQMAQTSKEWQDDDEGEERAREPRVSLLDRLEQQRRDRAVGLAGRTIPIADLPGWSLASTTTSGRWHVMAPGGDLAGTITRVNAGGSRPEWRAAGGDPGLATIGQVPIEPPTGDPDRGTDHTLWRTRTAAAAAIAADHVPG